MLFPISVQGRRGCCSHHGGVSGSCTSSGRIICNDGQVSPSCTCTPSYIYGCTDPNAKNYNSNANKNNGSCTYYRYGCNNRRAINYDSLAERNDGSCRFENIVETTVSIPYETIYQEKDSDKDSEEVIHYGKNGTKKIITKIIMTESGQELSRTVESEEIIEEPSNQIIQKNVKRESVAGNQILEEKETNSTTNNLVNESFLLFLIILFAITFNYVKNHKETKYLLSYIQKKQSCIKYILYFIYIILVFPVLIDFGWIIVEKFDSL